jgi:hypothetical protein
VHTFEFYAEDPWPSESRGGTYQWQLSCTATRRIASGQFYWDDDQLTLGDLLFTPTRASWGDLDGGAGEADLTDTAFADDRRFGYDITITEQDSPNLEVHVANPDDERAYNAALDEPVTLTAAGELQVTEPVLLLDYAQFRSMLRTGHTNPPQPTDEAAAVHELLVADLQEQPFDDVLEMYVTVSPAPVGGTSHEGS